jgi:symplekin
MDPLTVSVEEQIKQLGDARKLVLNDSTYYPTIIQAFLPIIAPPARVELRRWGADFLAETFASPTIAPQEKENLSLIVLETLKSMIEDPNQDTAVVKSVVQTAASIYPLVFRHTYVVLCPPSHCIHFLEAFGVMGAQHEYLTCDSIPK